MKKCEKNFPPSTNSMDCFAGFSRKKKVCTHYCAIRLRCAIEKDQNMRIELLEDLIGEDDTVLTIQ